MRKKTAQMTTVMNVEEVLSTSTRSLRTGIPLLITKKYRHMNAKERVQGNVTKVTEKCPKNN